MLRCTREKCLSGRLVPVPSASQRTSNETWHLTALHYGLLMCVCSLPAGNCHLRQSTINNFDCCYILTHSSARASKCKCVVDKKRPKRAFVKFAVRSLSFLVQSVQTVRESYLPHRRWTNASQISGVWGSLRFPVQKRQADSDTLILHSPTKQDLAYQLEKNVFACVSINYIAEIRTCNTTLSAVQPATAVRKARRFWAWVAARGHDRIRGGSFAMAAATCFAGTVPPTKLGSKLHKAYLFHETAAQWKVKEEPEVILLWLSQMPQVVEKRITLCPH